MKKRIVAYMMMITLAMASLTGCGGDNQQSAKLEGTCETILTKVYENADLDSDMREAMNYFMAVPIDESLEEYALGTDDVDYTDSVYSAPQMSSIAYQCVVLRLEPDENVEEAKRQLLDNVDPVKWVCVEAESVAVENVGDVILYVMGDAQTTDAIKTAFLALGE